MQEIINRDFCKEIAGTFEKEIASSLEDVLEDACPSDFGMNDIVEDCNGWSNESCAECWRKGLSSVNDFNDRKEILGRILGY